MPPRVTAEEVNKEISGRRDRRNSHLGQVASSIRDSERKAKRSSLKAKSGKQSLTAHHLLPYNHIRDSFASAVEKQDLPAMQNLLAFSGQNSTDSSEAFRSLGYQRKYEPQPRKKLTKEQGIARGKQGKLETSLGIENYHRPTLEQSSEERIGQLFKQAAWASHNVFMGPLPEKRTDDPHEGLDAQYLPDGKQTKSSLMAKEIFGNGFSMMDPVDFNSSLQSARNQADGFAPRKKGKVKAKPKDLKAHGLSSELRSDYGSLWDSRPKKGGTREYRKSDWIEKDGAFTQRGRERVRRERARLDEDGHKRRTLNLWG